MAGNGCQMSRAASEILVGISGLNSLSKVSKPEAKLLLNQEMRKGAFMHYSQHFYIILESTWFLSHFGLQKCKNSGPLFCSSC